MIKVVPLVYYTEQGGRVVIGEATVRTEGDHLAVVASVNPEYSDLLSEGELNHLSISRGEINNG